MCNTNLNILVFMFALPLQKCILFSKFDNANTPTCSPIRCPSTTFGTEAKKNGKREENDNK